MIALFEPPKLNVLKISFLLGLKLVYLFLIFLDLAVFQSVYFLILLLGISLLRISTIEKSFAIMFAFLFLQVVCIVAVQIYHYFFGIPILYSFQNFDWKTIHVLPGTFAPFVRELYVKPSGFFDEPGVLIGYILVTLIFKEIMSKSSSLDKILLILSLFSTSIAGVIFNFLYLVRNYILIAILTFVCLTLSLAIFQNNFWEIIIRLVNEFDNRTYQYVLFFNNLTLEYIFYGYPEELLNDLGANLFSPIAFYGMFTAMLYYTNVLTCFERLMNHKFLLLILVLFILQKPLFFQTQHLLFTSLFIASLVRINEKQF